MATTASSSSPSAAVRVVVLGDGERTDSSLSLLREEPFLRGACNARVVAIGRNRAELAVLPEGVDAVDAAEGETKESDVRAALADAEVLLNTTAKGVQVAEVMEWMPQLKWIHCRFAGVDHMLTPEAGLRERDDIAVTNAKGCYSSSLAEYALFGCAYFAKQAARLVRQREEKVWGRFAVKELRDATMGIVGYGDIGRACAKLAKAYGMRVLAQRRRPELSEGDELVDASFGPGDGVREVMSQSDYVVVATPLTDETRGMVGTAEFAAAKPGSVFINIGRGPVVDEEALADALRNGPIAGAVLDVFATEPLPDDSPLWGMDNLFMSPHCADMTDRWLIDSTRLFVDNMARYQQQQDLLNVVDKEAGY